MLETRGRPTGRPRFFCLEAFEAWMRGDGGRRLLAGGVASVETYFDATREKPHTSIFGFRDGASLQACMRDREAQTVKAELDALIGAHDHAQQMWPPVYRAPTLSLP